MCKIVARQVNPEYQDAHLFFIDRSGEWQWEDDYWKDMSILPEDRFYHTMTDVVESVYNVLEDAYSWDGLGDNLDDFEISKVDHEVHPAYKSRSACINDFLPSRKANGKGYSPKEIKRLCELVLDYDYRNKNSTLCEVLSIVTGEKYACAIIHGSSQGDCRTVIYPVSVYPVKFLELFETMYWNEGSEWKVYASSSDFAIDDYDDDFSELGNETYLDSVYCVSYCNDDLRAEIANYAGDFAPEDVVLLKYAGSRSYDYYRVA